MKMIIYIKLLGEGTEVYRPVSAIKVNENTYEVCKLKNYDTEDEVWEFPPGTYVIVEERILDGEKVFVAIMDKKR